MMRTSPRGIALITQFEGLRTKAYLCPAGVWTIGYGHTGAGVQEGQVITAAQAEGMLAADLKTYETCVNECVTYKMQQYEFDALVSLVYNIGCAAFRRSTLRRILNREATTPAASWIKEVSDAWSKWNKIGKVTSKGLARRRAAEICMFIG